MANCLIIDGNNLAHHLYKLGPARLVPLKIDLALVEALESWAASQERAVEVELCLDPRREKVAGSRHVSVFFADPGKQADGMIVGKVITRVYNHVTTTREPCLVVTSDEELRRRVAEFQVPCMSVREFSPPGSSLIPEFAPLPAKIPLGALPPSFELSDPTPSQPKQAVPRPARARRAKNSSAEYEQLIAQTLAVLAGQSPGLQPNASQKTPDPPSPPPMRMVQLSVATWPAQAGARFLMQSFCARHAAEVAGLVPDPAQASQGDLPVLAEILLDHCASEADFVSRGGCLMDRARLALLRAEGMRLTYEELACQTGDTLSEIRRKLRQKEPAWIRSMEVSQDASKV